MFWDVGRIYFLIFPMQNIKNKRSFFSVFFQSFFFFWWVIYCFLVIFIDKSLNFCYSFRMSSSFFMIYCDCYSILKAFIVFFIDKIYLFLCNWENLYMIHLSLNWFYCICNAINDYNQRQNHYLSLMFAIWHIERSDWKSSSISSSA